jgi:hypothetical protein
VAENFLTVLCEMELNEFKVKTMIVTCERHRDSAWRTHLLTRVEAVPSKVDTVVLDSVAGILERELQAVIQEWLELTGSQI